MSQPPAIEGEVAVCAALPFVVRGETTRQALLERLGTPAWAFENGRIVTWRLEDDGTALRPIARVAGTVDPLTKGVRWYGLVVVFDDHGVVQRFTLVEQA